MYIDNGSTPTPDNPTTAPGPGPEPSDDGYFLVGSFNDWTPSSAYQFSENSGNPGEYMIKQLAEETLRQLPESTSKLVYEPLPKDDPKRRKPDITLAKALLGWEPKVPLQEGLAKTIAYFRRLV